MSQKSTDFRAGHQGTSEEMPTINLGSYNGCSVDQSEYDSEAVSDSRERRLLADQTAEGLADIIERFWSKVDRSGSCWLWTASAMDTSGHGQFTIRDAQRKQHHVYAHRVAWALAGFNVASHLKLCHTCDVPPCVRPAHLFVGTQQDNLNDARQKGRLVDGAHCIKVSDADMRAIRAAYRPRRNGAELARQYGISIRHLNRVVNGTARVTRRAFDPFFLNNVERVATVDLPLYEQSDLVEVSRQRREPLQLVHVRHCPTLHTSSVR